MKRWRDPQWSDEQWRTKWLLGMSDAQLDAMTPREKGHLLPAYVWLGHNSELYGEDALCYQDGHTLARLARTELGVNPAPTVYISLGKAHRTMMKRASR